MYIFKRLVTGVPDVVPYAGGDDDGHGALDLSPFPVDRDLALPLLPTEELVRLLVDLFARLAPGIPILLGPIL